MYKIMFSVGEASGDLLGASVAEALKLAQPDAKLFGMGGTAMSKAGVDIAYDIKDLGIIGLVEVIKNLAKLFKLRDKLAELMDKEKPDVLVVVDYPGFNMRLAKIAKQKGIPVVCYKSPSIWAWGKNRAKSVVENVTKLAAMFPFEAEAYEAAGANVEFVGHPLLDIVKPTMSKPEAYEYFNVAQDKPVVLLMPGSRLQEITNLLPVMMAAAEKIVEKVPDCQFFIPVASTISREILQNIISEYNVAVNFTADSIYDLMAIANVAVAASGTVTLEAALMRLPSVVIYKVNSLTYLLGKFLVKIPYISLPNIVAGRKVVPELLQDNANAEQVAQETAALLLDRPKYQQTLSDLDEIKEKLGRTGAVQRVAELIINVAGHKSGRP